jgi:[CysO sulfur-carrier protein]-S-L-cysteine hydrolase
MIQITTSLRDEMVEHALREFPNEACGLLAGTLQPPADGGPGAASAEAEGFYPMTNADASPVTYRLDPREQLKVFDAIEEAGREVVGIVHSHTHSEAYPSETDRKQAFYPDAHYVLVSVQDRNNPVIRAFTIRDGLIDEQDVITP